MLVELEEELSGEEEEELLDEEELLSPDPLEDELEPEPEQPARQKASAAAPRQETSKTKSFFFTLINHPYRSDDGAVLLFGDLAARVQFYLFCRIFGFGQRRNSVENLDS